MVEEMGVRRKTAERDRGGVQQAVLEVQQLAVDEVAAGAGLCGAARGQTGR